MTVFVHPRGLCDSDQVGDGTRIWAFAHVLAGATVGRDCNICDHAFVEGGAILGDRVTVKNGVLIWDGVTIEDDVFVGPSVVFTNDPWPRSGNTSFTLTPTLVRRGASLGASVTVVCGTKIGSYATVGAGSLITRDVPPYALVRGVPAHRVGWVCRCGATLGEDLRCGCGLAYRAEGDGLAPLGSAEASNSR